MKLSREYLVSQLIDLQSDEFNPVDVMSASKNELILMLIESAYFYRNKYYFKGTNHDY